MITRTIGPYQPIELLAGAGPYSTHRAIDPRLFGQPVALTVAALPADDAEFAQRFEGRATALTALRHPNILPLLDFGETPEQVYLATPHLEGPTLATIIGQVRRPVEALSLIATLCEAMDHAHRLGLPHGNLTPEAVQLANLPPGEDTLFAAWPIVRYHGFAALIGPGEGGDRSPYAAPEDATGAGSSSGDRYALAAILYALLTGAPPVADAMTAPPDTLPGGLATTLRRALAADPASRFGSGADFVLALRDASAAARRNDDKHAGTLLEEARTAVAAGKLRAASESYSSYLLLRPEDEMARREFATIENRRAEIARRRAESTAAATASRPPTVPTDTESPANAQAPVVEAPQAPTATDDDPATSGWASKPAIDAAPANPGGHFGLRNLFPFGPGPGDQSGGIPPNLGGLGTTRQAGRGVPPRDFKPIASPARLRRQAVLPAVIAAAALILALALGGALISRQRGQEVAAPTPSVATGAAPGRASQAASTTRTPTRIAPNVPPVIPIVPTIAPLTPTPVPTLPPLQPVFADTFGDPNTGFPREPGGFADAGYQAGEYIVRVPQPDGFEIAELTGCVLPAVPDCIFGDMVLEVEARAIGPSAGGSYGLVFHRQFAGAYVQYFVLIDPEGGTVRLVRWNDTERVELIPSAPLAQIVKGEGVNRLTIAAKGRTITVGINGATLPTVTDPGGPAFGVVALRADAGAGPIAVHFDNFLIRPIR